MEAHRQASAHVTGGDHSIHILLVIPRIRGESGQAYQSVGMRLVNGLCQQCREYFQMEVLHAPTYARLSERLEKAKSDGKPFHVVHYDGHGAYMNPANLQNQGEVITTPEDNSIEGYLLLEGAEKPDLIDGKSLSKILVENDVSILSLNAAHEPVSIDDESLVKHAFEAVIRSCQDAGLPGALTVPYFYELDAPAVFFGDVYAALAQGATLGEAVKSEQHYFAGLASRPMDGGVSVPLNWKAPSNYERTPLLIAEKINIARAPIFRISILERGKEINPERIDSRLLKRMAPSGIYGRDELSLMLDLAFDHSGLLLLFGEEGTGKTCTAAEFSRWRANSHAGYDQPILYTSLANCMNLTEVLEDFGQVYTDALLERHVVWNELEDFQRQKLIQDVLKKVHLLWIWDDFESVDQDLSTPWEKTEKERLVEFIKSLANTAACLLIISNNAEKGLGEEVLRVKISHLPHHSLASLVRRRLKDHPILGITEQSILKVIGEDTINLKVLDIFHQHPDQFTSPASQASLRGWAAAMLDRLSQEDRKVILLIALFTTVLNIDALVEMAKPQHPWCLSEIKGYTRDQIQQALGHAEESGLITYISGRYYLLDALIVNSLMPELSKRFSLEKARLAFVNAMSLLSQDLAQRWENGDKQQIGLLVAEEYNLKHALILANCSKGRKNLAGLMKGLRLVYLQNGRYAPWARLLNTIAPEFLTQTGKLRREVSSDAVLFVEYCVEISQLRHRYDEAAKWQELRVDWERHLAADALRTDPDKLDETKLKKVMNLVSAQSSSGELWMKAGNPKASEAYKAAFRTVNSIKKTDLAAQFAYYIADGYILLPSGQDLHLAGRWIRKSLTLRDKADRLGRGKSIALFAKVALEKFMKAQKENHPDAEKIGYLNQALGYLFEALSLLPENAKTELGMIHEMIGYTYLQVENALDTALPHYDQAIMYKEQSKDISGAAKCNFNVAVALFMLSQFELGRRYALEALRGFESLGAAAEEEAVKARGLIAKFTNPADAQ